MNEFLSSLHAWIWGPPMLLLLTCIGLYLTWILRGIQFTHLGYALGLVFGRQSSKGKGDISPFQSLMTALAATMGIGNIAGVATAFVMGGPGALFWMWVTAFLGMAIKYVEAFLAVKYRTTDKRGEMCGGPMYFIREALNMPILASFFALFGIFGALGGGNILQANSVADVLSSTLSVDPGLTGIVLAVFVGITLLGGIQSIGKVAGVLVPLMALFYIGGALFVIVMHYTEIPSVFWMLLEEAFAPSTAPGAVVGGVTGGSLLLAMRIGVSKGLMTSESGLGTASIAAAAAKSDHPGKTAMISMTGSFLSTIVMCTVTALVLGVTGVLGTTNASGDLVTGASLTVKAFETVLPFGAHVVTLGLILFAYTTLLGWAYYGEKCVEFLLGEWCIAPFRGFFTLLVVCGAVMDVEAVWYLSDITNALMACPNLLAICLLGHFVARENRDFLRLVNKERQVAST